MPAPPTTRQQLEGEGRGDVVRDIGHAQVEVGELSAHEVAVDDLRGLGGVEFGCFMGAVCLSAPFTRAS